MLSFFRKLSIGSKIRDGLIMGTPAGEDAVDEATARFNAVLAAKEAEIATKVAHFKESIYDLLRTIRDPEKPQTLEELEVVYEDCIELHDATPGGVTVMRVEFNPTVPHCSLATLIGLCIRVKLERHLVSVFKLDIYVKEGAHSSEQEINKQINDKERIAAAMENPNLRELVEKCIKEEE